ncbi:MAG: hypothetical protein KBI45_00525 [Candidatus Saccharicenans sp.]|nr:hypothetical protein [Candidatus Saccharicenans sp.]
MKKFTMILLISGLILLPSLAQEVLHEYKIPPGWKLKSYFSRALYLLPDLPDKELAKGDVPPRLLIFDRQDKLISDLMLEPGWWFGGYLDDKILLENSDENGTYLIKLTDLQGKEIYRVYSQGRWLNQAILGEDFALVPSKIQGQIGPISIIDGKTGQEKFRLEPYQGPDGPSIPDGFLLIGEGFYVIGRGASLFLKSYYEPEKTFWQIWNIGGNIKEIRFLNKDLIAVGYGFDDFEKARFMIGVAVIEWRSGKNLFNKHATRVRQGENWKEDKWFNSFQHLLLSIGDGGELIIKENEDRGTILPPKAGRKGSWNGWDETRARKIKYRPVPQEIYSSDGKKARAQILGDTIIKDFGTFVRIERRKYVIDSGVEK